MIVSALFCLFLMVGAAAAFVDITRGSTNDVEYMTGGIGMDERQAMEEMAKGYNLKVVFAMTAGNYLSNIPVTILKPTGEKALETISTGPWLFAKLPYGQYTVKAGHAGKERMRTLEIGREMQVAMFHWSP